MRPVKLTLSAFGPYAERTVIPMEELGEKGLYLITGDTGAGKTTIFDGICYALFGEASGGNRESPMLRSKYADPKTPTEAELIFYHRGRKYRIRRNPEYERPKDRGTGFTKEPASAEFYLPDGTVVSKVREVNEAVQSLLGVTREQFSQISMLAQGEFLKLLLADTKERQTIFRDLFRTDCYQLLQNRLSEEERKLYGKCQDAKKALAQYIDGISCEQDSPFFAETEAAKQIEAAKIRNTVLDPEDPFSRSVSPTNVCPQPLESHRLHLCEERVPLKHHLLQVLLTVCDIRLPCGTRLRVNEVLALEIALLKDLTALLDYVL